MASTSKPSSLNEMFSRSSFAKWGSGVRSYDDDAAR